MQIIAENNPDVVALAIESLRRGEVIAFATDTVYGLAVDARNATAVEKLYNIKNRTNTKPIAIFAKDLSSAEKIFYFEDLAQKIAKKHFPGELTLVLKIRPESQNFLAKNLNKNNDDFLGFRIVNCNFCKKLFEKFDGFLAVTSANLSGYAPASDAKEIEKYFANTKLALLIDGGILQNKIPSTVAKIIDNKIIILRQGKVKL